MKFSSWLAVATMALAACPAAAQTAASTADSAPSTPGRENPCRASAKGCEALEADNRMRQAMRDACKNTPEACRAWRESAMKRRERTVPMYPAQQK